MSGARWLVGRWTPSEEAVLEVRYPEALEAGPRSRERERLCRDLGREWGAIRQHWGKMRRSEGRGEASAR